jgi:hypothetical protein
MVGANDHKANCSPSFQLVVQSGSNTLGDAIGSAFGGIALHMGMDRSGSGVGVSENGARTGANWLSRRVAIRRILVALLTATLPPVGAQAAGSDKAVYFHVSDGKSENDFVIALTDPAKIARARAIIAGTVHRSLFVAGTIVPKPANYNNPWHFFLEPNSIIFTEQSIEVCSATTAYVEAHLAEVGGAFLPRSWWCPWRSTVRAEVKIGHLMGQAAAQSRQCPRIYKPVCGVVVSASRIATYANSCEASRIGALILHDGMCQGPGQTRCSHAIVAPVCAKNSTGEKTYDSFCWAEKDWAVLVHKGPC